MSRYDDDDEITIDGLTFGVMYTDGVHRRCMLLKEG